MAIRKLVFMVALTTLWLPSLVIADHDHRATVVSRNGDRVSGNLDGVGKGLVYVRVNQNDQRQLPMGDVLVIDFVGGASGLPDTELSVAARPEHLVVFRNGTSWTGQFLNTVGGTDHNEPHQIVFRTGNEERRIGLDQVARIYLGNYPFKATATTATAAQNVPAGAIRVPANAGWVPTNITVRRGDRISFSVSGQIELSDESGDSAVAGGSVRGRRAAGSPIPDALAGALIGRVGNSGPIAIGDQAQVTMPAAGQLFLGVNDDHVGDNRGEFVVQVQNLTTRRQR
jgi:hypothetical protein